MIDQHTHSDLFSFDGLQPLEDLRADAAAAGLDGVCLTEHYDKDVPWNGGEQIFNIDDYFRQYAPLRQSDPENGPLLLLGIEFGYFPYLRDLYNTILSRRPFDCAVLSMHAMEGKDIFSTPELFDGDKPAFYTRHLREMTAMIEDSIDFDVLGHFDYISRYTRTADRKMRYHENAEAFDAMFSALIRRGKALEINTRTIQKLNHEGYAGRQAWPDAALLQRYFELGGRRLSIGSDAHGAGQAGYLFRELVPWINALGPAEWVWYRNRQPVVAAAESFG